MQKPVQGVVVPSWKKGELRIAPSKIFFLYQSGTSDAAILLDEVPCPLSLVIYQSAIVNGDHPQERMVYFFLVLREQCYYANVINQKMKIVVFQVFQQDSSPHRFLTVATGKTSWAIRSAADNKASYVHSASAGTSCPSSSSSSVSKREGWNSWRYYDNNKWQDGDIEVSCSNCNDMVLVTENVDSVHSSYQSLVQTGANVFST